MVIPFLVCVFLERLHFKSKQSCVLFRVGAFLRGGKKSNQLGTEIAKFLQNKRVERKRTQHLIHLIFMFVVAFQVWPMGFLLFCRFPRLSYVLKKQDRRVVYKRNQLTSCGLTALCCDVTRFRIGLVRA